MGPPAMPPCGHTDREKELTEIALLTERGGAVPVLVCTVQGCREYLRAYVDLRDEPGWSDGDPAAGEPSANDA